jgi:hypothetical protein
MSYVCPACGAESFHPRDEEFGFCARCHAFTGSAAQWAAYLAAVERGEVPMRAEPRRPAP